MIRENLYEPFEIVVKELDECPKKEHEHNFFELVYIVSGTGMQCINKNKFAYRAGHMFLITPEDCHSFDVETTTKFFFLRFNNIYIKNHILHGDNVKRLEYILLNANHTPGCILKTQSDKEFVNPVVHAIIREHLSHDIYNRELIHQLVNTLIVIVARNITKSLPDQMTEHSAEKALNIIQYLQTNIYEPDKIKAESISNHFGISVSYLGRYFKTHTNETMQDYITRYKLRLIENRLLHSDLRIGEIAREFSFTDESHLHRIFKKYKGLSPSVYRRQYAS
ncbi:AraC family transcriptional regulator [Pedobacter sp. L105]|uniref:helix-turn-helix domain-containing protein n=1 Tax=Pedobacter sp. L105 TaxID=1641871 RepID=UPI00131CC289|nr:AraC family transcriptional regulator [Pedobacter sp. L105]